MKKESSNIHKAHRERMKESFLKHGWDSFSDVQKLEFTLFFGIPFKDTNPTAHQLLDEFKSIREVINAPYYALRKVKGMGDHSAMLFSVVQELIGEYFKESPQSQQILTTSAAKSFDYSQLVAKPKEELLLMFINPNGTLKNYTIISKGTTSEVQVTLKDITDEV